MPQASVSISQPRRAALSTGTIERLHADYMDSLARANKPRITDAECDIHCQESTLALKAMAAKRTRRPAAIVLKFAAAAHEAIPGGSVASDRLLRSALRDLAAIAS